MTEHILNGIVFVLALGIGAQWLAWRFRVPGILLLLIFGFVAGPLTGEFLLDPAELRGDWLFAFVSVSIGIILFEGGLSLRIKDLREIGRAVFNLITVGVLVTWALAGLGAYYLLGFPPSLSVLTGAILTVTGPTVVIPLLRHVRPTGRVGTLAKWEGITIDPVGAILAVLVLETVLLIQGAEAHGGGVFEASMHAVQGLLLTIFIAIGISVLGAALLILLLRRRLVPDYLQSSVALAIVVATFALSNFFQEESGLLEVTLLGIMMANQRYVPVRRISEFKENLQVLLIGALFILLSARLDLSALDYLGWPALIFLAGLIFLVRPLAVWASSLGTNLSWKEQAFLAWLAPRGIVAAAVASLFSFRLEAVYPAEVIGGLVPIIFLVIVGTVAVYGLTISPVARWLGLAEPNAQGVLILGAHAWAQQVAKALQEIGVRVLVVDSNARNVERARQHGLRAETANALSESIIDELDLGGIGRFFALTPNDEVNSLAALHFSEVFESTEVYQLAARPESRQRAQPTTPASPGASPEGTGAELPQHLRGRPLFGESTNHVSLNDRFNEGDEVRTFELTDNFTWADAHDRYGDDLVLLFVHRSGDLLVHAEEGSPQPQAGDTIVALVTPEARQGRREETPFERLVARSVVIDVEEEEPAFEEIVRRAAAVLARRLDHDAERLADLLLRGSRYGAIPIAEGAALPHLRLPDIAEPMMALVRCQHGTRIEQEQRPAPPQGDGAAEPTQEGPDELYALFFLVSDENDPGEHLRILANVASRLNDAQFLGAWRTAEDEQALKETLLRRERFLRLDVDGEGLSSSFIDKPVEDLNLPGGGHVVLVRRGDRVFVPAPHTVIEQGDRLTVVGEPQGIRQLRQVYVR